MTRTDLRHTLTYRLQLANPVEIRLAEGRRLVVSRLVPAPSKCGPL